jgi:hypothetical protein
LRVAVENCSLHSAPRQHSASQHSCCRRPLCAVRPRRGAANDGSRDATRRGKKFFAAYVSHLVSWSSSRGQRRAARPSRRDARVALAL